MYYNQNPNIVELPDDIQNIQSISFTSGETPTLTVIFALRPDKIYDNPTQIFATNGVSGRIWAVVEKTAPTADQASTSDDNTTESSDTSSGKTSRSKKAAQNSDAGAANTATATASSTDSGAQAQATSGPAVVPAPQG
jgi:hypothetical protein